MRFRAALGLLACAAGMCAQAPTAAEIAMPASNPERVRSLVDLGVLPRTAIGQAELDIIDREDARVLDRTLYGRVGVEELTEQQADDMMAAAERRFERRKQAVERAKKLVDEGALARLALTPYLEDLDGARRTLDMARSRANLLRELEAMVRAEEALLHAAPLSAGSHEMPSLAERFLGDGEFRMTDFPWIAQAFEREFGKPLPVSARGETALHRSLGFDHRGRVDVALDPDQPEGLWLRNLLHSLRVPFYAFRAFVPGKSTGPHIHIGPPSASLRHGG